MTTAGAPGTLYHQASSNSHSFMVVNLAIWTRSMPPRQPMVFLLFFLLLSLIYSGRALGFDRVVGLCLLGFPAKEGILWQKRQLSSCFVFDTIRYLGSGRNLGPKTVVTILICACYNIALLPLILLQ
ncbi:hypothetical protein F4808DRAFT_414447 [Astrocystis sublimbata]|nr:hypothetical protein F4808DRAFT_414447 [Astrocystis sublimbata]